MGCEIASVRSMCVPFDPSKTRRRLKCFISPRPMWALTILSAASILARVTTWSQKRTLGTYSLYSIIYSNRSLKSMSQKVNSSEILQRYETEKVRHEQEQSSRHDMQPMPIHQSREPSPEDSAWESTAAQRTPPGRIFRLWIRSTCSRYPQRNIIHDGVFFPVATETGRSLTFPNPSEFSNMSYMLGRGTSKPPWCLAGIGASAKSCKNRSAASHDTQQIQAGIQFQFPGCRI